MGIMHKDVGQLDYEKIKTDVFKWIIHWSESPTAKGGNCTIVFTSYWYTLDLRRGSYQLPSSFSSLNKNRRATTASGIAPNLKSEHLFLNSGNRAVIFMDTTTYHRRQ